MSGTKAHRRGPVDGALEAMDAFPQADDSDCARRESTSMVPMLEEPGHVTGTRRARLSPMMFYALTAEPREDLAPWDDGIWLTEEPLKTVHKDGIKLGGRVFFDPALLSLTSGPSGSLRPNLVIRYDRALLARGVLKEVRVYERDDQGRYHELCTCGLLEEVLPQLDAATVIRERNRYIRDLLATRTTHENEFLALERGTEALQELINQRLARERLQRVSNPAPISPKPIFDEAEEEREALERRRQYHDALRDREERKAGEIREEPVPADENAAAADESPRDSSEEAPEAKKQRKRKEPRNQAVEKSTSSLPQTKPGWSSMGSLLGGKTGL